MSRSLIAQKLKLEIQVSMNSINDKKNGIEVV